MDATLLYLKSTAFLAGAIWLCAPFACAKPPQQPMTVCELIQHINALDGRIVSFRGLLVLHSSDPDDDGPDYVVARCPALDGRRVRIKIEYPDAWFLEKPPRGYKADKGSFHRAAKVIRATLQNRRVRDRWIATIVGQANSVVPWPAPPPNMHVTLEDHGDAEIVIEAIYRLKVPPRVKRTSK